MKITNKFDNWVARGPFTPTDLGIYRIIYALCALFTAPDITYLVQYPQFMFHAPPGPLQLLTGFPPYPVLIALELLRSASLILLGLGLWTRYTSIASALMLYITYGLTYCFGRIDHTILIVLAPLVLAFANWGDRISLDSYRRTFPFPSHQEQWPLRLFAILIGWGFFVAAFVKVGTDWLSPSSQAARGYFILSYTTQARTSWPASWIAIHDPRVMWELLDWFTVIFEGTIIVALIWWRVFRIILAIATIFHLSVLLIMGIDFSHAVVAYGAFVSWGTIASHLTHMRLHKPITSAWQRYCSDSARIPRQLIPLILGIAIGTGAWFLMTSPIGKMSTGLICSDLIIAVGAAIGLTYLYREAGILLQKWTGKSA